MQRMDRKLDMNALEGEIFSLETVDDRSQVEVFLHQLGCGKLVVFLNLTYLVFELFDITFFALAERALSRPVLRLSLHFRILVIVILIISSLT